MHTENVWIARLLNVLELRKFERGSAVILHESIAISRWVTFIGKSLASED